jgi:hypothetical protein
MKLSIGLFESHDMTTNFPRVSDIREKARNRECRVAQVVECLSKQCAALSSNPSTAKPKIKKKTRRKL